MKTDQEIQDLKDQVQKLTLRLQQEEAAHKQSKKDG